MANPLLAVFESQDAAIDTAWDEAFVARTAEDRRIARVILKAITRMMTVTAADESEHVAQFTESAIEARVIGLAFYWGNDLEDVAFATLGLKRPDFAEIDSWQERSTLQAKWWQEVVVPEMNRVD